MNCRKMKTKMPLILTLCLAMARVIVVVSAQNATRYPATIIENTGGEGPCPAESVREAALINITRDVYELLREITNTSETTSTSEAPSGCEGSGWSRAVFLNMTDPFYECPSGWKLSSFSKRSCEQVSTTELTCDSAMFSTGGDSYSAVCGRIIGYQYGGTTAFNYYSDNPLTIDDFYVEGASLTHGPTGSRQHIWTFAAGLSEVTTQFPDQQYYCTCDNPTTASIIPSYVGSDYFCEAAALTYTSNPTFYPDDPLWDGNGCSGTSTSTCCTFNSPPWFTKELPSSTTDDLEIRICDRDLSDSTVIELIEIYVR